MCQLQLLLLVILLITVLVLHNVIYLEYFMPMRQHMRHFMPMRHVYKPSSTRRLLQLSPPTPPPNTFSPALLFYK